MPLTQEQIDKLCRMVDFSWAENEKFMVTTRCTTCGQVGKCIASPIDLSTTCKECYKKKRLEEMDTEERKAKCELNLKDFAKL